MNRGDQLMGNTTKTGSRNENMTREFTVYKIKQEVINQKPKPQHPVNDH